MSDLVRVTEGSTVTPLSDEMSVDLDAEYRDDAWAKGLRRATKVLANAADRIYIELARHLWAVANQKVDGEPVYEKWGYNSYFTYASMELGFEKRKAQYLVNIWDTLYVQMKNLPEWVRQGLVDLGYSKLRRLVSVMDYNNAEHLLKRARDLNCVQINELVRETNERLQALSTDVPFDSVQRATGMSSKSNNDPILGRWGVKFRESEMPVVDEALRVAHNIATSGANYSADEGQERLRARLLTLICMDYLATNGAAPVGTQSFRHYIANLERLYGLRFIVYDVTGAKPDLLYGYDRFVDLVQKARQAAHVAEVVEAELES